VHRLDQPFLAVDDFRPSFAPPSKTELKEIALRKRPDLATERARARRSDWAIELEKARSKPNVTAFAGYQRELDTSGPVAGIDLPLFVFNRNQGPIHRAQAEKRRQENRLLLGRITVLKEVHTALQKLEGDRRRIRALESEYLDRAKQAKQITEASYRLGEASLIEFLDAERTYSETTLLYNQALYDFEISRARLESAVGEEL
jgi:cobalt-zinc-cadmium efflux system outer membrane protein